MQNLEEIKSFLRENMAKGVHCPACEQFVKVYRRPMHATMALTLIRLYHLDRLDVFIPRYHHVKEIVKGISDTGTNDFSKLRYWGLIEEEPKGSSLNKKSSGMWKITTDGINFVRGSIEVPSRVIILNKRFLGFTGEPVTIQKVLGERFNYHDLMKNL